MTTRIAKRNSRSRQQVRNTGASALSMNFLVRHRETAKEAFSRLLQTPIGSLMTALVIAVALLLPGFLRQLEITLDPVTESFQDSARITLFMHSDVSEQRGLELSKDLLEDNRTGTADYLSRADALAEFRTGSGLDTLIDELNSNPLPASITVVPLSQATAEVEALAAELRNLPEVESIRVDLAWIQRLSAIRDLLTQLRILLAIILAVAVVLIIGNTTRMSVENRAREIEVIKLVGGTPGFIALPFLYSGLLLGAAGGLLAGLLLLGVQSFLSTPIDTLLSLYNTEFEIQKPGATDILFSTAAGAALGWLGALVSIVVRLYSSPP